MAEIWRPWRHWWNWLTPSDDEKRWFQNYQGNPWNLGPADQFLFAVLEVINVLSHLHAILYWAQYSEELHRVQESIVALDVHYFLTLHHSIVLHWLTSIGLWRCCCCQHLHATHWSKQNSCSFFNKYLNRWLARSWRGAEPSRSF